LEQIVSLKFIGIPLRDIKRSIRSEVTCRLSSDQLLLENGADRAG
jgi:hypothetical protein